MHANNRAGGRLNLGDIGQLVDREEFPEQAEVGHDLDTGNDLPPLLRLARAVTAAVEVHEDNEDDGNADEHVIEEHE